MSEGGADRCGTVCFCLIKTSWGALMQHSKAYLMWLLCRGVGDTIVPAIKTALFFFEIASRITAMWTEGGEGVTERLSSIEGDRF